MAQPLISPALLILLVALVVMAAGIACVIAGVILYNKSTGSTGICGKCGYSVNQLQSMTCPECGADLREAGIRTTSGGKGALALIVLGCVILFFSCIFIGGGLLFAQRPAPVAPVVQQAKTATPGNPSQPAPPPAQPASPSPQNTTP